MEKIFFPVKNQEKTYFYQIFFIKTIYFDKKGL